MRMDNSMNETIKLNTAFFADDSPQLSNVAKKVHFFESVEESRKREQNNEFEEIRQDAEVIEKLCDGADPGEKLATDDSLNWSIWTNDSFGDDEVISDKRNASINMDLDELHANLENRLNETPKSKISVSNAPVHFQAKYSPYFSIKARRPISNQRARESNEFLKQFKLLTFMKN